MIKKCLYCDRGIKNCWNTQKYHKSCHKKHLKEYKRKYNKRPEIKERMKINTMLRRLKERGELEWHFIPPKKQIAMMNAYALKLLNKR